MHTSTVSHMHAALDTIRSAVCQTRLLINEKLRQFKSLCSQAEVMIASM